VQTERKKFGEGNRIYVVMDELSLRGLVTYDLTQNNEYTKLILAVENLVQEKISIEDA
jgi:hypothetical protein